MATIAMGRQVFTLVNVFTVKPENQQQLAQLLIDATEQTMKHLPGFVSASIHKSHDGKRDAMRQNPRAGPHMAAAAALATFEPFAAKLWSR